MRTVGWRRDAAVGVVAFVATEPLAYAGHRWGMHGPGWAAHESHHRSRAGVVEANDLYPLGFAAATIVAMSAGVPRRTAAPWRAVLAASAGVTAYGAAYSVVHEIYAHRRVPRLRRRARLLEVLGERHMRHHRRGGEPFGMLLPVVVDGVAPRRSSGDPLSPPAGDPLVEVRPLCPDGGVVAVAGEHQGAGIEAEQTVVD